MKQSQQSRKKKSSVQVEKLAPCPNQNSESDENHGEELGDEFPVKVHYQHILKQQKLHYTVEQRLLFQCGITKLNRLKLQVWLSEECEKGCFLRETFATINKYLELYMTKCEKLPITSFQLLGLACFRVAAKVVESRSPPISYHSFDPNQILAFQKQLCFMLGFRIQPFTYVSAADLIFLNWQNYQQIHDEQKQISFLDNRVESLVRNHAMMEILDCLSLIPEFSEINIYSLVLCMFFFVHRFYLLKEPYPKTQKEAIQMFICPDSYHEGFVQFCQYLSNNCQLFSNVQINADLISFILPGLSLKTRQCSNYSSTSTFPLRTFHTHNANIYPLIRSLFTKKV